MESVLQQTYPEVEYLVIDGGSTDGTLETLAAFESRFDGRMRWISEPDQGIYDAMNKGITLSSGELVGLLNADDAYLPDAVEHIVAAYRDAPQAGLVYGDSEIVDEQGAFLRRQDACVVVPMRPDHMPMCHQSLFVARRTYDEIGLFDTQYRVLADYEWMLRALSRGVTMVHVPEPIARFRTGGASTVNMDRSNREREQIRVKYGANPLWERLRRVRHTVNIAGHRTLTSIGRAAGRTMKEGRQ